MEDARESKSAFFPSCLLIFFLVLTYPHISGMVIEFVDISFRQSRTIVPITFRNFVGLHGHGPESVHLVNCSGE